MSKKYHITAFGEALIDFTPNKEGAYVANVGGAPLNLAVCGAKYGCKSAFVGKLGRDAFGALIVDTAKKEGVDTRGVVFDGKRVTTHAFVTLDENGDRDFVFCREHGADTAFDTEELPFDLLEDTALFHFGGLSLTHPRLKEACINAVDFAKKGGAFISFDPNYRSALWDSEYSFVKECNSVLDKADVLKVSLEEALMLTGEATEEYALNTLERKADLVLLTKGGDGAVCAKDGKRFILPPVKANTVDTTGAGDIFFGTFLSAMLTEGHTPKGIKDEDILRIGAKACYCAAKSTEKYGAIPSIPNFSEEK